MKIIVAAHSKDGAIAVDNAIPWKCPEDLKFFKEVTTGGVVIMGRKTADTLKGPLPDRLNIIVSRNPIYSREGFVCARDINHADHLAEVLAENKPIFYIGGGEVYKEVMSRADAMVLSEIDYWVSDHSAFYFAGQEAHKEIIYFPPFWSVLNPSQELLKDGREWTCISTTYGKFKASVFIKLRYISDEKNKNTVEKFVSSVTSKFMRINW